MPEADESPIELDFLETIKLVNYIRQEARHGRGLSIDVSAKTAFQDDHFLLPVLADDPLLYSLEDVIDSDLNFDQQSTAPDISHQETNLSHTDASMSNLHLRVLRAQEELRAAESALSEMEIAGESSQGSDERAQDHQQASYQGNYDGAGQPALKLSRKPS